MSIKDYFIKLISGIGYLGLLVLVPILTAVDEKVSKDNFMLKGDVKLRLKKRGLLKDFNNHELKCSGCHSTIHFDNLGLIKTNSDNIHLYCRDPGCTLKA
jgi:hypothetical protein